MEAQERAWERRKTQDQPITQESPHKENPAHGGLPLTRPVTQIQEVRSPSLAAILAAQPDHVDRPSVTMPGSRRPSQQRCSMRCGPARLGSDEGLVVHMGQKHGGQPLIQESVAQLRQLDRAACDRGKETAAIIAERTPRLGTYSWVISSKIGDSHEPAQPSPASCFLATNSARRCPG